MGSNSSQHHKAQADQAGPVALAIVTVSDSRTPETDVNARFLHEQVAALGHHVVAYQIVPDEPEKVTAVLHQLCETEARLILFNGGTGIAPRDTTFDALDALLEKQLPGFGSLSIWQPARGVNDGFMDDNWIGNGCFTHRLPLL